MAISADCADPRPAASAAAEQVSDPAEDPYSPGSIIFSQMLGGLIALLTISVPLTVVMADPGALPALTHGSAPPSGLSSAWAGERVSR